MKKNGGFLKKVFSFKKNGKFNVKKLILSLIVLIVIVVLVVCSVLVSNKDNNEKELTASLESLGKDFYENYYYDAIGKTKSERKEVLSKFTTIGIKIDLENLIRYNSDKSSDLEKEFVNEKTGESCDTTNSKVIIYPSSGYKKTDYKIEVVLDCGFDTKTTTTEESK